MEMSNLGHLHKILLMKLQGTGNYESDASHKLQVKSIFQINFQSTNEANNIELLFFCNDHNCTLKKQTKSATFGMDYQLANND